MGERRSASLRQRCGWEAARWHSGGRYGQGAVEPFCWRFVAGVGLGIGLRIYRFPAGAGQLQSIAITPLTADAQNYPNGQVPFVATGIYVNPPHIE